MTQVIDIVAQQRFWNQWNATHREHRRDEVPTRQAAVVCSWLDGIEKRPLDILEVGCGAGWFCDRLSAYGQVTATDLSDEVLGRAMVRMPHVHFVAGDFMDLALKEASFDVVVSLEVLSHVGNQPEFLARIARLLRPGGRLMLATQNRPVLEHYNDIPAPGPGQLRRWVSGTELRDLLEPMFNVDRIFSVTPRANRGVLRYVNSPKLNRPIRALVGERVEHLKERLGLGWTLMALAHRRG